MKSHSVRALSFIVALTLLLVMFTGCNPTTTTSAPQSSALAAATTEAQPTTATTEQTAAPATREADKYPLPPLVEFVAGNWGWDEPVPETDIVEKAIAKSFGADVKINAIKVGSYDDFFKKMQMWASTGMTDWPGMIMAGSDTQTKELFNRLGKQGKIIDWMTYMPQFPHLMDVSKIIFPTCLTEDGKLYAFPVQYTNIKCLADSGGLWLRKDWMEQLKLEYPKTTDDFVNVLKAFRDNIKAADGQAIIPMSLFGENFVEITNYFYPNYKAGWYWDADKKLSLNMDLEDSQYLINGLTFQNMMYHEGLIPKDCFTLKQGQIDEMASQGRVGSLIGADWTVSPYMSTFAKDDPTKMYVLSPYLYDPSVNTEPAKDLVAATPYTCYAIKADLPPEMLYAYLKYMDWCASKDGTIIPNFGVEGVHWEYNKDGRIVDTADCAARLKGDWTLRVHEGIGWYGTTYDYDVFASVVTTVDPNSPSVPPFLKESYKIRGFMTYQGYVKDPNAYITPGTQEIKLTTGLIDRRKTMVIKAVTGDPKDIPGLVKAYLDTIRPNYATIQQERSALCQKLDMSYLP